MKLPLWLPNRDPNNGIELYIKETLQCTVQRTCLPDHCLKLMCSVLDCNSPNECQFKTNIPLADSSEAENRQKYKTVTRKSTFFT